MILMLTNDRRVATTLDGHGRDRVRTDPAARVTLNLDILWTTISTTLHHYHLCLRAKIHSTFRKALSAYLGSQTPPHPNQARNAPYCISAGFGSSHARLSAFASCIKWQNIRIFATQPRWKGLWSSM